MKKHMIFYITGLLLFGLNGIVAGQISIGSSSIVFFRTMIGSALLITIFYLTGGRFRFSSMNKKHLACVLVSGVAMGISWIFLYEAYRRNGVGFASLIYYTGPVFVVLLSPFLFREKLTVCRMLCFAVVLAGMVLMNLKQLQGSGDHIGLLCAFGSALMYAVMVIFSKKAESITGLKNAVIQLTVSFLTVAVFMLVRKGIELPGTFPEWIWLLILGLLNTGAGCYLYFSSIGHLPVQTVSVIGYVEPLSALIFSIILLHESFCVLQAVGAALILGGAAAINIRRRTGKGRRIRE